MNINFQKQNGLIPAIIQDARTNQVLMLGFMNSRAFQKTSETKRVTFYSRSKKRLWTKGETSGNYLEAVEIKPDCDGDALLIKAIPKGPICHTKKYSCFGVPQNKHYNTVETQNFAFLQTNPDGLSLESLFSRIKERKRLLPDKSYTTFLLQAGLQKMGEKIIEEAGEVVFAAKHEGRTRTIEEASDLLYHLLVLIAASGIEYREILQCLAKRSRAGNS